MDIKLFVDNKNHNTMPYKLFHIYFIKISHRTVVGCLRIIFCAHRIKPEIGGDIAKPCKLNVGL